jgi:hypothetical protein
MKRQMLGRETGGRPESPGAWVQGVRVDTLLAGGAGGCEIGPPPSQPTRISFHKTPSVPVFPPTLNPIDSRADN